MNAGERSSLLEFQSEKNILITKYVGGAAKAGGTEARRKQTLSNNNGSNC